MSNKLQAPQTAGFNAIGKNQFKMVSVDEIIIDPDISGIYKIDDELLKKITQDMVENGYDESQPVTRDKKTGKLLDGHTRLQAAKNAGLEKIQVVDKDFENPDDAILYTYERQSKRRNLASAEIIMAAEILLKKREAKGGTNETFDAFSKRLGIDRRTLFHSTKVLREGTPEQIKLVKNGEKSAKKVCNEIDEQMNPDKKPGKKIMEIDTHEHSGTIPFLKGAIILLVEAKHAAAADILVNHFLRKNERKGLYDILPEAIRDQLSFSAPVHS